MPVASLGDFSNYLTGLPQNQVGLSPLRPSGPSFSVEFDLSVWITGPCAKIRDLVTLLIAIGDPLAPALLLNFEDA